VRGDGILILISVNVGSITTVEYKLIVKCFAQLPSAPRHRPVRVGHLDLVLVKNA